MRRINKSVIPGAAAALTFKVETRKAEVQLSGFVDNQGQIDRAIEVTRGIDGVSGVGKEMSIKKQPRSCAARDALPPGSASRF